MKAGTRIGSHDVVSPLGAGGMGEVWRAHDTRIDRDVAIKVLPEDLASDPERLARFELEAKAAGAVLERRSIFSFTSSRPTRSATRASMG